ncbi:hypothetical protein [Pseudomonas sp. R16(2017)]|uniref:hypothetical protein n=1 Tax=Pseudomonas sp. R16(2017) TaxID=1981704 RepID=UPI00111C7AC6|nr:hypothetical protein [Pseudomonas sp. R16(2017)]
MKPQEVTPPQALAWVRWWADAAPPSNTPWPAEWRARHAGMGATRPAPPNGGLLPLLVLDAQQWAKVLSLAVAVCAGSQGEPPPGLDDAGLRWCRRLGRALQPGHWLPARWREGDTQSQGLRLLRAWVGEPVWQRLRLEFACTSIEDAPLQGVPHARLASLWQAVGWYALTFTTQGSPHADPSPTEPEPSPGVA